MLEPILRVGCVFLCIYLSKYDKVRVREFSPFNIYYQNALLVPFSIYAEDTSDDRREQERQNESGTGSLVAKERYVKQGLAGSYHGYTSYKPKRCR